MTDELEDKDLNEEAEVGVEGIEETADAEIVEPDFVSPVAAPAAFDDHHDDEIDADPHAEPFHRTDAVEASFTDPYGVGVPMGSGEDYDDEEEEEEGYLMNDSDSY